MITQLLLLLFCLLIICICILFVIFVILSFQSDYLGSPFVSNDSKVLDATLDMVEPDIDGIFYDLGSGNGNVIFKASQKFSEMSRFIGIEAALNPYIIASLRSRFYKNAKIKFIRSNILTYDFSDASIIYIYLLPKLLDKLSPRLVGLKNKHPELQIISSVFPVTGLNPLKITKAYHPTFKKEIEIYLY